MIELHNEDCLDVLASIGNNTVDLVVTDPPYKIISGGVRKTKSGDDPSGIFNRRHEDNKRTDWVNEVRTGKMFKNNTIKFGDWVSEVFRVLKDGTHCYVMVNDRNMQEMLNEGTKAGFKLVNILVWKKNNCTPNKYYMKNSEFIILFRKGKARSINNMGSKQVIEINNIIGNKIHPTEKPVELIEHLIGNSSNEGDLVLDPFLGGGSAAVASQNLNRRFIGIELDDKYFDIAKSRLKQEEIL